METLEESCARNALRVAACIHKRENTAVHTAVHEPTGTEVILKVQRFGMSVSGDSFAGEIVTQQRLKHPAIVDCYGGFWYYSSRDCWDGVIVLERMESDLWQQINQRYREQRMWTDKEVLEIAYQLLDVFAFCEMENICHRDIKPHNIFLTAHGVKVGDFGISKSSSAPTDLHTICGSAAYLSPLLRRSLIDRSDSAAHNVYKSDVYSLGVTILCMCVLGLPKQLLTPRAAIDILPVIDTISYCDTVKVLLKAMLEINENKRLSFSALQVELAKVMEYDGKCRHVKNGLKSAAVSPCHGDLCEYCCRKVTESTAICRICMTEFTVETRKVTEEVCVCCQSSLTPSAFEICANRHKVCSNPCLSTYCQTPPIQYPVFCPSCKSPIPDVILAKLLSSTVIPGLTLHCSQCQEVALISGVVLFKCNVHGYCTRCYSTYDYSLHDGCQLCAKSAANSASCVQCDNLTAVSDLFSFDCGHTICGKCYNSSTAEVRVCAICAKACSSCDQPITTSQFLPLRCGHITCQRCFSAVSPCGKCAKNSVKCIICNRGFPLEDSIPLECGRHSACFEHIVAAVRCSICRGRKVA